MAAVLTDTDVLIDALRRRQPAAAIVRGLMDRDQLATTTVTVFELFAGPERDDERIRTLLRPVTILELTTAAALAAASIDHLLRAAGLRIATADCLIAGTAVANRIPLLTRNVRHFERIPGLELVTV